MKEKDLKRRLQEALKMDGWDRFWYSVIRFFSKQYLSEYGWLLKVQDALDGKESLDLTIEDKWKLVIEEGHAHIQETTAMLSPFYEARTRLEEEASYLDCIIREERKAREHWKSESQEVKNELSRMEALVETQYFGSQELNHLTIYRRRLLVRKSEALFAGGLSQRRLIQATELRGKVERFLAYTQSQRLAYELRRSDFVMNKESACLEYQLSSLGGTPALSSTKTLQNERQGAQEKSAVQMEDAVESASFVLENPLEWYKEEDLKKSRGVLEEFERDLSDVLRQDQEEVRSRP
ncbi:MAG: hypothetical protein AABX70_00250 [Nanoarchaeota archaeon]